CPNPDDFIPKASRPVLLSQLSPPRREVCRLQVCHGAVPPELLNDPGAGPLRLFERTRGDFPHLQALVELGEVQVDHLANRRPIAGELIRSRIEASLPRRLFLLILLQGGLEVAPEVDMFPADLLAP